MWSLYLFKPFQVLEYFYIKSSMQVTTLTSYNVTSVADSDPDKRRDKSPTLPVPYLPYQSYHIWYRYRIYYNVFVSINWSRSAWKLCGSATMICTVANLNELKEHFRDSQKEGFDMAGTYTRLPDVVITCTRCFLEDITGSLLYAVGCLSFFTTWSRHKHVEGTGTVNLFWKAP